MKVMDILIKDLKKIYNPKKSNEFVALKGINVEIKKGELVAIIGKSGSGKSTLLNIIAGISGYSSGSYKVGDKEIGDMNDKQIAGFRNKDVGLVMQDFALIENYTIMENVMLPMIISKEKHSLTVRKAEEAIKSVDLYNIKNKKVNELSGGQKQRVAIARAIINEPQILLADEPTGALDSKTSKEIMDIFVKLNKEGKTVLIVTHDEEVANNCSRIITISDGLVVA
ncbi:MAG: ABC transporter ATP-binding protein [Lachnospiraceae bacterium]|nr:ABC transporter ATP-binding protein [Lachnospiraceae bacterium]MBQ4069292.1 ABC transporter ATP-binding protein [Lachnospiraceae bacterium]